MIKHDADSDGVGGFGYSSVRVGSWLIGLITLLLVLLVGVAAMTSPGTPAVDVGDTVEVDLVSSDGETISTVTAETATTKEEMETGLSDHESLSTGNGMLFYHPEEGEQTYVMPDMDFGIDIVFIGADCTVESIQAADPPAEGDDGYEPQYQHTADAKYILEVPQGYASERLSEGDTVRFTGGCR